MVGSAHVRDAPWQMAERLQHISTMGFTAVELMPIHEFNELEYYSLNPSTGEHRFNFWGYSTVRQTAHTQTSHPEGGGLNTRRIILSGRSSLSPGKRLDHQRSSRHAMVPLKSIL
jgi:hypothetical protein